MTKVFITDEVNDNYTADVTNAGKVKVETADANYKLIASAQTTISAQAIYDGACYVKGISLSYPATASTLIVYNTYVSAGGVSAFGTSGDNIVTRISIPVGHGSAVSGGGQTPFYVPLNVYLASGLSIGNGGHSANDSLGYVGCFRGGVVTYQA